MYALCSVATRSYLPGLITLYRSVLRHQDIPLYVMVPDADPEETGPLADSLRQWLPERVRGQVQVVGPAEILAEATERMRFYYDAFEFATACKAAMHAYMLRRTGVERWLYLDSDMLCLGSLAPMFAELDDHSLLLTAHRDHPDATMAGDLNLLGNGAFNAGVLGIRRSPAAAAFVDWYLAVLSVYCLNDTPRPKARQFPGNTVLAADQRWLDLVPAYFPGVRIAKQRGFNLGHWNVDRDRLSYRDGHLHIGADPVLLLHLSGWSATDPGRFSRYADVDWSGDPAWQQVCDAYLADISALGNAFQRPYPHASYPDGSLVSHEDRRRYLDEVLAGIAPPGNPFLQQARFLAARRPPNWRKRLRARLRQRLLGPVT